MACHPVLFLTPGLKMTGVECVEGMAGGLYQELFAAVVSLINRYCGLCWGTGSSCTRQVRRGAFLSWGRQCWVPIPPWPPAGLSDFPFHICKIGLYPKGIRGLRETNKEF